jgi:hypothetical protein
MKKATIALLLIPQIDLANPGRFTCPEPELDPDSKIPDRVNPWDLRTIELKLGQTNEQL